MEALKRQRGRIVDELKTVTQTRRREADLQTLESEVSGLENRLNMTKRSREIAVSTIVVSCRNLSNYCCGCYLLSCYTL